MSDMDLADILKCTQKSSIEFSGADIEFDFVLMTSATAYNQYLKGNTNRKLIQ